MDYVKNRLPLTWFISCILTCSFYVHNETKQLTENNETVKIKERLHVQKKMINAEAINECKMKPKYHKTIEE